MWFDQLPYRKIPVGENQRRIEVLNQFRQLLWQFLQPLGQDAAFIKDHVTEQRRRAINQAMPSAARFVRLTGLSSAVPDSQREYLSSRSKFAAVDAKLDLLDGFFWQETPGLQQQALDLVDQAIGVYKDDEPAARFRTFNPFFWLGFPFDWLAESLFAFAVRLFGHNPQKVRNSGFAIVVVLLEKIIFWAAALATVLEFLGFQTGLRHLLHLD
jgi:hypothetical protein